MSIKGTVVKDYGEDLYHINSLYVYDMEWADGEQGPSKMKFDDGIYVRYTNLTNLTEEELQRALEEIIGSYLESLFNKELVGFSYLVTSITEMEEVDEDEEDDDDDEDESEELAELSEEIKESLIDSLKDMVSEFNTAKIEDTEYVLIPKSDIDLAIDRVRNL